MKKFLLSAASALLLAGNAVAANIGDTYEKVVSASDLVAGTEYILCYDTYAMGALNGKYCTSVSEGVSLDGTTATIEKEDVVAFTLVNGTETGTFAIQFPDNSYLSCTGISNNSLKSSTELVANCNLSITLDTKGVATIIFKENPNGAEGKYNKFQCNTNKDQWRFSNYKTGTQKDCTFYKKAASIDPTLKDPELAFSATTVSAVLGMEWNAPTLTKATNAEVTYSSSVETVAEVQADGTVTLVAPGTTVITATAEANSEYRGGHASYTLTVIDPNEIFNSPMGEDFTFDNGENTYPWSHDDRYGLKGTAFVNKVSNNTTGYAISPVIDLTGRKSATLNFDQAFNNYKKDNVLITDLSVVNTTYAFISVREEGAAEWTDLEAAVTNPTVFNWNFFANDPVDLSAYAGKKIQVAFKYVSVDDVAGTWEIQNISVVAEPAAAPEIPDLMIAGEVVSGDNIKVTEEGSEISFPAEEGVSVYYKWEPANSETPALFAETTDEGFTLYTEPFTIKTAGKLSYYAESYGVKTEVKSVNITVATGIEGVEVSEEADAVYYNLMGVRVANPERGVFVKVQGGKSVKIVK